MTPGDAYSSSTWSHLSFKIHTFACLGLFTNFIFCLCFWTWWYNAYRVSEFVLFWIISKWILLCNISYILNHPWLVYQVDFVLSLPKCWLMLENCRKQSHIPARLNITQNVFKCLVIVIKILPKVLTKLLKVMPDWTSLQMASSVVILGNILVHICPKVKTHGK